MMFGKNLGQHGAGFLGAIFVVARNEDDVFSVAWFPFSPGEAQGVGLSGGCGESACK